MARRPVLLIYERVVLSPFEHKINAFITNLKEKIKMKASTYDEEKKKLKELLEPNEIDINLINKIGQNIYDEISILRFNKDVGYNKVAKELLTLKRLFLKKKNSLFR